MIKNAIRLIFVCMLLLLITQSAFALNHKDYCFEKYGQAFNVDPAVLEAISWVESRHDPAAVNANNANSTSIDYGHMQINSYWIDRLLGEQYVNLDDPCFCTAIGAYILRDCINSYGLNQNALSCYNSGKSLDHLTSDTRAAVESYISLVRKKYVDLKHNPIVKK